MDFISEIKDSIIGLISNSTLLVKIVTLYVSNMLVMLGFLSQYSLIPFFLILQIYWIFHH